MSQIFAAEEELSDSTGLSHGSIAIGVSETALNIFLFNKLKAFHMTYPGIRLKLYNYSTPQAIDAVKVEKSTLLLFQLQLPWNHHSDRLSLQPFQEILVGGTTFTALGGQELSLAELKKLSADFAWT